MGFLAPIFMKKKIQTYVPEKFDKFVVTYNGLAYWFRMKGQYLFRVSTEQEFHDENANAYHPKVFCKPIDGTIVPLRQLFRKRSYFVTHPVNQDGHLRQGVDMLIKWMSCHPEEQEDERSIGLSH